MKKGSQTVLESCSSKISLHKKPTREFKKMKSPTFNGEMKYREEVGAWLLVMSKYFQVYDYSNNMEARIAIYNMNNKASIRWQDLKLANGIK